MLNKQLELLVALQDLDIMIRDIEDVRHIGFDVQGKEKLKEAREDLVAKINKPLLFNYEKLKARYKRSIVPVKDDICLGCFGKDLLPLQQVISPQIRRKIHLLVSVGGNILLNTFKLFSLLSNY